MTNENGVELDGSGQWEMSASELTSLTRIPTGWDDEVRLFKITLCHPSWRPSLLRSGAGIHPKSVLEGGGRGLEFIMQERARLVRWLPAPVAFSAGQTFAVDVQLQV